MNSLSPHSLSPRTLALLERAHQQAAPQPEALARVRARLQASAMGAAPSSALALLLWNALRLLGVAAVATLAVVGAWRVAHDVPPAPTAAASCPAVPVPPRVTAPPPALPAAPACASPPAGAVGPAAPREVLAPSLRPREGSHQGLFSVPRAAADGLQLELGLLNDARVALDEGRLLDALGHAERHQELFPKSAFIEERLALQVLAYCALGRGELAQPRLEQLLRQAPQSGYLPRVRETCGALAEPVASPEGEDE